MPFGEVMCETCHGTSWHQSQRFLDTEHCTSCPKTGFCCTFGAINCLLKVAPNLNDILLKNLAHFDLVIDDEELYSCGQKPCFKTISLFIEVLRMNPELLLDVSRDEFISFYDHFRLVTQDTGKICDFNKDWYTDLGEAYNFTMDLIN